MSQNNRYRPENERERLLRSLMADASGLSESDQDDLAELAEQMSRWQAPEPDSSASAQLLAVLTSELPAAPPRLLDWWPVLLVRAQVRVTQAEIWAASALVMALGVVVTLAAQGSALGSLTPFTVIAPIVAAVGVALLYDIDLEQVLELEDATPASARVVLLARLMLVFSFDLALALVGSLALALLQTDVLLWPLVLSWLGPMAFLSGLAFLLSVVTGHSLSGMGVGLLLWGVHLAARVLPDSISPWAKLLTLPGLSDPQTRPLLLVAAIMLVAVALWLAGRTERRLQTDSSV